MSDNQRLTALIKFLKAASPEVIAEHISFAEEKQGASFEFSQAAEKASAPHPADAPPLWAERKPGWNKPTGQKASPVLWIKMHYGNKDLENWDGMGLTRADLRHDKPLYLTLAKQLKGHPEYAGIFSPNESRRPYIDPQEAVERVRLQKRTWARNNSKKP